MRIQWDVNDFIVLGNSMSLGENRTAYTRFDNARDNKQHVLQQIMRDLPSDLERLGI